MFLLQSAVVDSVYPVSEGGHSRLRLRQGKLPVRSLVQDAHAEQLPYALGDVVDAALNLSVYESRPGRAALWPHHRPAPGRRLGAKLARQAALVRHCAGAPSR